MAAFTENEIKEFNITKWYDLSGQVAVVTGGWDLPLPGAL